MPATIRTTTSATGATAPVRLKADVFDKRCEKFGARTETAKADLVEVDRVTLHRLRRGSISPRLDVALRFAERLNMTVEQLWERS